MKILNRDGKDFVVYLVLPILVVCWAFWNLMRVRDLLLTHVFWMKISSGFIGWIETKKVGEVLGTPYRFVHNLTVPELLWIYTVFLAALLCFSFFKWKSKRNRVAALTLGSLVLFYVLYGLSVTLYGPRCEFGALLAR